MRVPPAAPEVNDYGWMGPPDAPLREAPGDDGL